RAKALATMGLRNVGQLLAHLPSRHERLEAESPIDQLAAGSNIAVRGTITASRVVLIGKKRVEAALEDDTGRLDLVWFNQPYMREKVHPGTRVLVEGKARRFGGRLQLTNPKLTVLAPEQAAAQPIRRQEQLRPVYSACEAIASWEIERCVQAILDPALPQIIDHFPEPFRRTHELLELSTAYRLMHRPMNELEAAQARRRLAYDELFLLQLGVALKRAERRSGSPAIALPRTPALDRAIRSRLKFTLTDDQSAVVDEIAADLAQPLPANRLIQGDVGSGKTAVALYAMLLAVAAGHQAALMAPTELLAEQHAQSITSMLSGSSVRIELLTGAIAPAHKAAVHAGLADGTVHLAIGTHALLSEGVAFKSLALAVIDEQHRFGVHQRALLRQKAEAHAPHLLVMTATPIPRTLGMTLLGDLDVSTIRALPPGRKPISTRVLPPDRRDEVYQFVRQRLDKREQAYVVVPAIDQEADLFSADFADPLDAPTDPAATATAEAARPARPLRSVNQVLAELQAGPLQGYRLAAVHGRMSAADRDAVMDSFRRHHIDLLVATTVIEVGVDVPNATIIVVEDAERFGLAQLHQLRGRVGRGSKSSACVLIGDPVTDQAAERLKVMAKVKDGFTLAEKDLEIRGFGDLVGVRQSGMPPFKVADLVKDLDLLAMARRDAFAWAETSPRLARHEDSILRRRLLKAHGKWLGLADVG
ncbi:MAG: ATP-dependent DNA helicase RecG, partial [bacterium]